MSVCISIEKMIKFLDSASVAKITLRQLQMCYKSNLFTEMEYTLLCNLLLIPVKYRLTNGAKEATIRTFEEQVCANLAVSNAFARNCSRVRDKLNSLLSDMSEYYWDPNDTTSLNIMGNIVYNVAVQQMTYKRAVDVAFKLAALNKCNLINAQFLLDFFKDYFYVAANGAFYTPYKLIRDCADLLNAGECFSVYEKIGNNVLKIPIYVTSREIGYVPWVQSVKKAAVKVSVKTADAAKTTVTAKATVKQENNQQNNVCTLEHWLNSDNIMVAEYYVYSDKNTVLMHNKRNIERYGNIPCGAVITTIKEFTSADMIKLKPTKELQNYLMCRTAGTSEEADVWHVLRNNRITRNKVTQHVNMLKCLYFTDETAIAVGDKKRKYIHISEMEMYLLKDAVNLNVEKLKALKFYVKIGEFYIETVNCALHEDYIETLLNLAEKKLNSNMW